MKVIDWEATAKAIAESVSENPESVIDRCKVEVDDLLTWNEREDVEQARLNFVGRYSKRLVKIIDRFVADPRSIQKTDGSLS